MRAEEVGELYRKYKALVLLILLFVILSAFSGRHALSAAKAARIPKKQASPSRNGEVGILSGQHVPIAVSYQNPGGSCISKRPGVPNNNSLPQIVGGNSFVCHLSIPAPHPAFTLMVSYSAMQYNGPPDTDVSHVISSPLVKSVPVAANQTTVSIPAGPNAYNTWVQLELYPWTVTITVNGQDVGGNTYSGSAAIRVVAR